MYHLKAIQSTVHYNIGTCIILKLYKVLYITIGTCIILKLYKLVSGRDRDNILSTARYFCGKEYVKQVYTE